MPQKREKEPARTQKVELDTSHGMIHGLIRYLQATSFYARAMDASLFAYTDGCYWPGGERVAALRIVQALEEYGFYKERTTHLIHEVVEGIRLEAPALDERPPSDTINVRNGLVDIWTGERRDHSPEFLSPVQLPVVYNPKAKVQEWDWFIESVFPSDSQDIAWELPAYLLTPHTSIQKAVLLIGEGRNGKTRYCQAITALIGRQNTSCITLQKLETDRFAVSQLYGKLANIVPDLPTSHLTETAALKAITGGDPVNAERKFRESFDFVPYSRLVFGANQYPRSNDSSHGFFSRWQVIPFPNSFQGSSAIDAEELHRRLTSPLELSGVLNRCLPILRILLRRGSYTASTSMTDAFADFRDMTDPTISWLSTNTRLDPKGFVIRGELHREYVRYCTEHGFPVPSRESFASAVYRVFSPRVISSRTMVHGVFEHIFKGLVRVSNPPSPTWT